MTKKEKWLKPHNVAEELNVTEEKVLSWIISGNLPVVDFDGSGDYRIREKEFHKFIDQQQTKTAMALEQLKMQIEEEAIIFENLYEWMQEEYKMLTTQYQNIDDCLLDVLEQYKEGWERCLTSGERAKAQVYQEAMMEIYNRWEKPKQDYQQWLMNHEKRWQIFMAQLGPMLETNAGLMAPADPYLALNMSQVKSASTMDSFVESKRHQKDLFQALYLWMKRENNTLLDHYKRMERTINRVVDSLQRKAKKSSKSMEFERGQTFQETAAMLYRQWEKVRNDFNRHHLLGQQRWSQCQSKVKMSLANSRSYSSQSDSVGHGAKMVSTFDDDDQEPEST
ncbi:helix-turn-helix domain-containing protein [Heliorestis acidaminivorans]|uniref:Helix-turn-helix domain-containing protein n=1 Tax=Heliorestis acidaminivorans TaxID=553427 RepID=A0A6I0F5B7_9FIRM|nr:helix-turn-helix domain-containing protein [Heliorestis acidaminivorans]KAB2952509.1 helix-turn-helix domain-containing protein [Heliorestis acidaminivorans]